MSKENNEKKQRKTGRIIGLAAITSAIAGASAALLLAPKTGKETRETLKNSLSDGKESLTEKSTKLKDNVSESKRKIAEYLDERKRKKIIVNEVYLQAFDPDEDEDNEVIG